MDQLVEGRRSNKRIGAGLNIVNEAGTPIITRTPWRKGNLPKTRFDVEMFNQRDYANGGPLNYPVPSLSNKEYWSTYNKYFK